MLTAAVVLLAALVYLVLRRVDDVSDDIYALKEAIMAQIDEAVATTGAKADTLLAKVNEAVGTLGELKVLVEQGQSTGDAEAALAAINDRIDAGLASLTAAEDAADPTPDTPPE
jgi:hypothetical protein